MIFHLIFLRMTSSCILLNPFIIYLWNWPTCYFMSLLCCFNSSLPQITFLWLSSARRLLQAADSVSERGFSMSSIKTRERQRLHGWSVKCLVHHDQIPLHNLPVAISQQWLSLGNSGCSCQLLPTAESERNGINWKWNDRLDPKKRMAGGAGHCLPFQVQHSTRFQVQTWPRLIVYHKIFHSIFMVQGTHLLFAIKSKLLGLVGH